MNKDIVAFGFLEKFIYLAEECRTARQLIIGIAKNEITGYNIIINFEKKIKKLRCRIAIDDIGVDMFQGCYISKTIKEIREIKQYAKTKQMKTEITCTAK